MWDGPQARAGAKRRTTLASGEGVEFYVPFAVRNKDVQYPQQLLWLIAHGC